MEERSKDTPRILVVGSSGIDMTIYLERLPKVGETLLGGDYLSCPGGKGANQAVAAARAGGQVDFVASLGTDHNAESILSGLSADNIGLEYIVRNSTTSTGTALIFVSKSGENSIGVAPGANALLSKENLFQAREAFEKASVLLLQLEVPLETVEIAAELAVEAGTRVILNPAPAQPLSDELLRKVSILTPNETEAQHLTGISVSTIEDAKQAAHALRARGVDTVIITLGENGAFVSTSESEYHVPAFEVEVVDTVAAGDVFNGALAVRLAEGADLRQAVLFANAAAAHSVTVAGAQSSAPMRSEIEKILTSAI